MLIEAHTSVITKGRPKSVRFTPDEEAQIQAYARETGEAEALILERAVMRGLQAERLDRAVLWFLENRDSSHAAEIAGVPRAVFLEEVMRRGVVIHDDTPAAMLTDLSRLAELLGDDQLRAAVEQLQSKAIKH